MFLQVNKCPGLSFGILFNLPSSGRAGNKVALGFSLSTLGQKDIEEYIVVSPFLLLESAFPKCYWIGQKKSCFSVGTYSKPKQTFWPTQPNGRHTAGLPRVPAVA